MNIISFGFFISFISSSLLGSDLIILNGTSCSGKTSSAREFCSQNLDYIHKSIDEAVMYIYKKHPQQPHIKKDSILPWNTFHQEIRDLVENGQSVIYETCFMDDAIFRNALLNFAHLPVKFIKISVNYEVAKSRLKTRNHSQVPSQHRDARSLAQHFGEGLFLPLGKDEHFILPTHYDKVYDLEIDSTAKTIRSIAQEISNFRKPSTEVNSFFQNHQIWFHISNPQSHQKIFGAFLFQWDKEQHIWVRRSRDKLSQEYNDDYLTSFRLF